MLQQAMLSYLPDSLSWHVVLVHDLLLQLGQRLDYEKLMSIAGLPIL